MRNPLTPCARAVDVNGQPAENCSGRKPPIGSSDSPTLDKVRYGMRERDDSGSSSGTAARSARLVFRSIKTILGFLLRTVDFCLRHLTASKLRTATTRMWLAFTDNADLRPATSTVLTDAGSHSAGRQTGVMTPRMPLRSFRTNVRNLERSTSRPRSSI